MKMGLLYRKKNCYNLIIINKILLLSNNKKLNKK